MSARLVPVALAAALLVPAAGRAQDPGPLTGPARAIRVEGGGIVSVRPDVAVVHMGVDVLAKDLSEAVGEASARMRRLLAALREAGVAERDVRTTRHEVRLERDWEDGQPGEVAGYAASQEVRVVVRELSRLPAVLERATAAGANVVRGLAFERGDPAPERREALARAVADARAKAEAVAKASGVAVGEVLRIEEVGVAPPMPLERGVLAARAEGAPVSPGELEVSARVEVTYGIR